MGKRFVIPNGRESQLTIFPWMTTVVPIYSLIVLFILVESVQVNLSGYFFLLSPFLFVNCLMCMHTNISRWLQYLTGVSFIIFGLLIPLFFQEHWSFKAVFFGPILFGSVTFMFGYFNFKDHKATF
jgi:hypothetical protein